ncbi:efflux RND transporter periplasmic adaptor subunit [Burkholderiaceae bacterium DAT-1]|nr:efflux RND transporter periplasmic adaptor subunit [Burkholderiaceae bacterium DAT-1]
MSHADHNLPVSGAGMDEVIKRNRKPLYIKLGIAATVLSGLAWAGWQAMPHGLVVSGADLHIASVTRGVFHDDIIVRGNLEPANSVVLDSVEGGRVEQVLVKDGTMVKQGQPLYRLSNPNLQQNLLMARYQLTQAYGMLSNAQQSAAQGDLSYRAQRRDLQRQLDMAKRHNKRNEDLSRQGFISAMALESSQDAVKGLEQQLDALEQSYAREQPLRDAALKKQEDAVGGMADGVKLVANAIDALTVRAPIHGQLTNFSLQVGMLVQMSTRVGRIDDPSNFKLTASVDEYYVSRVHAGQKGAVSVDGQSYSVNVVRAFPQVKDGRFQVELAFDGAQPKGMRPGQSVDARLTLGDPKPALLLPYDAFINDTGGAWVFVADAQGKHAERRAIRTGRRSSSQIEVLSGLNPGERVVVSTYATFAKAHALDIGH